MGIRQYSKFLTSFANLTINISQKQYSLVVNSIHWNTYHATNSMKNDVSVGRGIEAK